MSLYEKSEQLEGKKGAKTNRTIILLYKGFITKLKNPYFLYEGRK